MIVFKYTNQDCGNIVTSLDKEERLREMEGGVGHMDKSSSNFLGVGTDKKILRNTGLAYWCPVRGRTPVWFVGYAPDSKSIGFGSE